MRGARSSLARLLAAVAAILVLGAASVAGPPAAARPSGAPTTPPPDPERMSLESITTFVAPEDVIELDLRLHEVPQGATLDVELHDRVTAGRLRFLQTVAGENLGPTLRAYRDLPVADLPTDEAGDLQVDFAVVAEGDAPLAGFRLDEAGVHPLVITLHDAGGDELDQLVTHVVRLPAPGDPEAGTALSVATVVPIDAPLALRPGANDTLTDEDLAGLDRALGALTGQPDVALTVMPTPETLEALGAREDDQGDGPVQELADSLQGRQVLARPFVPLATSGWVAAGDDAEIVAQLDAGLEVTDRLLDAPARRGTWVLDPTIDPPTLSTLRGLGVDRVVIPQGQLAALPSSFDRTLTRSFVVRDADGAPVPAMSTDGTLGLELISSEDPALAANRVLADLAVLHLDENQQGRGVVLQVPTGAATPDALPEVLEGLATASAPPAGAAPVLTPVTLDGLFTEVDAATTPGTDTALERTWTWDQPADLGQLPLAIDGAEATLRSYRTMLPGGSDPTAALVRRYLLASAHRDISEALRKELLDRSSELITGQTAAIEAPPQGAVTLTSSEGSIPVVLENGLDEVVRVRLSLMAEKLDFPDGAEQEVDLQPGTNRVEVQVRARASGAFPVEVGVSSPDGTIPIGTTRVQVRSTAVSGLGLLLAVAAGAFLALWWARNLRSGRRRQSLVSAAHPAARSSGEVPTPASERTGRER